MGDRELLDLGPGTTVVGVGIAASAIVWAHNSAPPMPVPRPRECTAAEPRTNVLCSRALVTSNSSLRMMDLALIVDSPTGDVVWIQEGAFAAIFSRVMIKISDKIPVGNGCPSGSPLSPYCNNVGAALHVSGDGFRFSDSILQYTPNVENCCGVTDNCWPHSGVALYLEASVGVLFSRNEVNTTCKIAILSRFDRLQTIVLK